MRARSYGCGGCGGFCEVLLLLLLLFLNITAIFSFYFLRGVQGVVGKVVDFGVVLLLFCLGGWFLVIWFCSVSCFCRSFVLDVVGPIFASPFEIVEIISGSKSMVGLGLCFDFPDDLLIVIAFCTGICEELTNMFQG